MAFESDRLDKECELNGPSADNWMYLQQCRKKLKIILKEEEIKWLQRSKDKELMTEIITPDTIIRKLTGGEEKIGLLGLIKRMV